MAGKHCQVVIIKAKINLNGHNLPVVLYLQFFFLSRNNQFSKAGAATITAAFSWVR